MSDVVLVIPDHQRIGQAIVNALCHKLGTKNEDVHRVLFYISDEELINLMEEMAK
jgi:hypothetical protein